MANNIKGITIQIGGDTTGLDKALKGVNTQAKSAQNELKEVNKALKLDPSNTELLEQKQRALAASVSATTEKLDMLKTAQEQALDQLAKGEIGQEQYDALTREITKTEAELKKCTTEANNFSVGMEKAKTAVNAVGSAAESVATKTKGLSTAAGGLVTAIGALAYKTAQGADELNTLSQQTGISTDDLQKMAYAADRVDVSVDNITGAMSKMKKQMAGSGEVFDTLGVAVRDANGEMRDSTDVFYEVLEALAAIPNETERDTVAMQVFGKSADQLAGIVDDGGAKLRELGAEAENLGLILDEDTLTSLNEVNDTIDQLKAQAGAELAKAGAEALEALSPVLETVIEKLGQLFEWIGSLDESQMQTILTIAAVIAAISPIAGIIATICGAISSFLTIWPSVQAAGAAVKAFAAANPALLIMTAIAALAALIIANWDKIRPVLEAIWQKVTTVFQSIKKTVVGVFEAIKTSIKSKINAILGLINALIAKVNVISSKANGLLSAIGISIPQIPEIPLLANGGSLGSGSAIVGEGGPELLTMRNGRADVTPLTTTTNTYNTYNNTSQRPVEIQLVCDGLTLAKAMYKPMQQVGKQYGPALVR